MRMIAKSVALSALVAFLASPLASAMEALPTVAPSPKDNPQTTEKVELGKMLYFDPRLSIDGTISCNSCHNVMSGGDDSRSFSSGVRGQRGGRSAPTVWNAAFLSVQFWDGRAKSLEEQAKGPITNPIEMGMPNHKVAIKRLKAIPGYKVHFKKAFKSSKITIDRVAKAIAAYERTLITPNSPFDRFIKGDKTAMSKKAQKGFETFKKVGCTTCHNGVAFAGPKLAEGTGFFMKFPTHPIAKWDKKYGFTKDTGRFEVTKNEADKFMFRVPTLRNIALTAPYFHNGAVNNLEEAVKIMGEAQLNKKLKSSEVRNIVAFLKALTGEFPQQTMPRLPTHAKSSLVDLQ